MHNKELDKFIEFETFKNIVDETVNQRILQDNLNNELKFIFHGGEILTVEKSYLDRLLQYVTETFKKNNINYMLGTQTNLTLLDEEFASIFKKYNVVVGISYDGHDGMNDYRLKNFNLEEKLEILKKYGILYNYIITITKLNIKKIDEVITYLLNTGTSEKGIKYNYVENINVTNDKEEDKFEITGKELYENLFLKEIEYFYKNKKFRLEKIKTLVEDVITDILTYNSKTYKTGCEAKYCGGGTYMITVGINGQSHICDRYDIDYPHTFVKNIPSYDFLGINQLDKAIQDQYKKYVAYKENGCNTCEADSICEHGCMGMYYSKHKKYGIDKNIICSYFKPVYKYIKTNLEEFLNNIEILEARSTILTVKPEIINSYKNKFIFKVDNNNLYIKKVNEI
jgi:uncharacterized protein